MRRGSGTALGQPITGRDVVDPAAHELGDLDASHIGEVVLLSAVHGQAGIEFTTNSLIAVPDTAGLRYELSAYVFSGELMQMCL